MNWTELPLVDRIGRESATDLFSEWPWSETAVIEARRCPCGELLTRVIEPQQVPPQISCAHLDDDSVRDVQPPAPWNGRASWSSEEG